MSTPLVRRGRVVARDDREDDQPVRPLDLDRWADVAEGVLVAERVDPALELTLAFVDAAEIARLKAEHLDGDGDPTDVLAFPIDTDAPPPGLPGLLGDVVVCPSVAEAQAADNVELRDGHDGSVDAELALLVIHGILHLLGHDHEVDDDAAVMRSTEERLLARALAATGERS